MLKKFNSLGSNKGFKRIFAVMMALCCLMSLFCVFASATDAGADMTAQEAATSIFTTMTEHVNVGAVVGVIAIALGAAMVLYFAWWGIRKVVRMVKGGLNGKVNV